MFEWIKNYFSVKEEQPLIIRLDISEPVISFMKCVENNPKRFEVNQYYTHSQNISLSGYIRPYQFEAFTIWDKEINRGWSIKGQFFYNPEEELNKKYEDAGFLTNTEKSWLISEIRQVYNARVERYNQIINTRKQRRIRDERNRLKEIYK